MLPRPNFQDANILSRTTLHVDDGLSTLSLAQLVHALQRVPGVLLAEIAPGNSRAIVAHDSAVPGASLLAAAKQIGVVANIVAEDRSPARSVAVVSPQGARRRLLTIAATLLLGLALAEAFIPHMAGSRLLLPLLLGCMWAFVIGRALFSSKPKP